MPSWEFFAGLLCAGGGLAAFLSYQNNGLRTQRYIFTHRDMPRGLKGFKIVQISDYHNAYWLKSKVLSAARAEAPDIIALTGDLFDCRRTDIAAGMDLAENLLKIAPVYYVTGNHEARLPNREEVKSRLSRMGVSVMDNRIQQFSYKGAAFTLIGARDPRFKSPDPAKKEDKQSFRKSFLAFAGQAGGFKVLLSHRPEFIHTYREAGIALALTGHAHGGQFGIPFTDMGLYVPNQGILPKYARGMKRQGDTVEIISRGIGNSSFPFRLFNRPEVVSVEFCTEE